MNEYIDANKDEFEKCKLHYREGLKTLRTGRANPTIVENMMVESYGTMTPLKQLANFSIPDVRTITITPWDKALLKEIAKVITYANIGLNPSLSGDSVIINLPMLTEENRKDLVKIVNQKAEDTRIAARNIRDKVKEKILAAEKSNEITEDERFRFIKELDEYIQKINQEVKGISEEKEKEIMTL